MLELLLAIFPPVLPSMPPASRRALVQEEVISSPAVERPPAAPPHDLSSARKVPAIVSHAGTAGAVAASSDAPP